MNLYRHTAEQSILWPEKKTSYCSMLYFGTTEKGEGPAFAQIIDVNKASKCFVHPK